MKEKLTNDQALSILVTGCRVAQGKGIFTLEDASVILEAIKVFTPAQPVPPTTAGVPTPAEFMPEIKPEEGGVVA